MMASDRRLILVVEDSDAHYEALVRALRMAGCSLAVRRCADGDDALDYLFQREQFANPASAPRPSLILLDLNLPGTDGHGVLGAVKSHPQLKAIPVVVVTSLCDPAEIRRCYEAGVNGYLRKRNTFDELVTAARSLATFWFETGELPECA